MTAPRAREQSDPPRGLVRSARALAAAALLALSGTLVLPATAQADVLVSNIGQTDDGLGSLTAFDQAQVFTTGGAYSLTSVEIEFVQVPSTGSGIHVSIWDDNGSGRPGSQVGSRLTNPASFSVGTNEFSASGIDLAAATKYYVVVDVQTVQASGGIQNTASDAEDSGAASDWSIGNNSLYRTSGQAGANWQSWAESKKIRINGIASDDPPTNNAPVFSPTTATRTVEENSAAGTNVGAVIPEATDTDSGDTLTYSMEGTDAASFAFDASTRQITTITGVTYNHEATKNSYSVTVKASDGTASATIAVTIDVTDVNEKSAKPDKPTLAKVTGSSTTLTATWTKPDLNGGPDIASLRLCSTAR